MSLIEELGGYSRAKQILHGCTLYGRHDVRVPVVGGFIHVVANFLEQDLLKYRRQHNIYEVGDPVIRKWNNQLYWIISNIDNSSEFLIHKNKDAKFKDCKVCELPCNLSHAIDTEIKEGKRL